MKYIDTEKLKAEIDRRYEENREKARYDDYYRGMNDGLDHFEQFLDSLQQEQPMPDSTKLIELWHEDKEMLKEKDFRNDQWRLAYNAFLCGFGRGIAVNKQEQHSEDLEEAAEKQIDKALFKWSYDDEDGIAQYVHDAFLAGAEWQKKQMMKDSAEGEVVKDISNKLAVTAKNVNLDGFKFGDKVRIIIVKEEEQ